MRWSDRNDDDKLEALLRGEGGTKLGAALTELREQRPEAPDKVRELVRGIATREPDKTGAARPRRLQRPRISYAQVGLAVAAALVLAVAVPAIVTLTGEGGESQVGAAPAQPSAEELEPGGQRQISPPFAPPPGDQSRSLAPNPVVVQKGGFAAPRLSGDRSESAPLAPGRRAQDYSAQITLHVDDHDELSESVQSAIRTTRRLGGYVTYVDYGTSGPKDGAAELQVRVPVGRVQAAIAAFAELGTILEQQTEIRDLQGQVDRLTRDLQRRRDRIAKLEAELRDPTLSDAERDRLEARLVQAKRGLAEAARARAALLRKSSFARLELAFTTEEPGEAPPPPGRIRNALDDAAGILADEVAVAIYVLVAGAPFLLLAALAFLAGRSLRRAASTRVLERA